MSLPRRLRRGSLMAGPIAESPQSPPSPSTGTLGRFIGRMRSNSLSDSVMRSMKSTKILSNTKSGKKLPRGMVEVNLILPDGERRTLQCKKNTVLAVLMVPIIMEYKLRSYRVHMASTRAILSLDVQASNLTGDDIQVVSDDMLEGDSPQDGDLRLRSANQLLRSECQYQEALRSIFEIYAEPLRKFSSLTVDDHKVLFFGLEPLLSLSAMICLKLEDIVQNWDPEESRLGNLFAKQFWHHYQEYTATRYQEIKQLLLDKQETNEEFREFCKLRRGAQGKSLEDLVHLPVERVPEYHGYLKELLHATCDTHVDYEDLSKALNKISMMTHQQDEEVAAVENIEMIQTIQSHFPSDNLQLDDRDGLQVKSLTTRRRSAPSAMFLRNHSKSSNSSSASSPVNHWVSNSWPVGGPDNMPSTESVRIFIMEGPVQISVGLQMNVRYLFLFSDLLLIAKPKSTTQFKLKERVRMCEMWIDDESKAHEEKSFIVGWPTTNVHMTFATPDLRDRWIEALHEQMHREKMKEEPKTVMLKVTHERSTISKNLLISNVEEAAEFVKRCMEEFRIEGDEKEYRLIVSSGRDDSEYVLSGHEHPYSIKMSHIRDAAKASGDDMLHPLDLDADNPNCQFILRHTKDSKHDQDEKKKKTNRKSPLRFFKKRSGSNTSTSSKLFGQQLTDSVPKPIMDILHHLFIHGPYTCGIFRKSANARVCRQLKERLDAGDELEVEEVPPLVAGATLKEFLRCLPDGIIGASRFKDWLNILNLDLELQIKTARQLYLELPGAHQDLVRYLMCVLYHIDRMSETNNMTAYNMGVCIGPSFIWASHGSEAGVEEASQISFLVEFLIRKCNEVFGDGCTDLFGEPAVQKPRQDSSTDSDSTHSLLDHGGGLRQRGRDSSLDSLELSEMDSQSSLLAERGSSHVSTPPLSCDSGLAFSDSAYTEEEIEAGFSQRLLSRSLSQNEEPRMESRLHNKLSHSYESTLNEDSLMPPVPPPRRRKKLPSPVTAPHSGYPVPHHQSHYHHLQQQQLLQQHLQHQHQQKQQQMQLQQQLQHYDLLHPTLVSGNATYVAPRPPGFAPQQHPIIPRQQLQMRYASPPEAVAYHSSEQQAQAALQHMQASVPAAAPAPAPAHFSTTEHSSVRSAPVYLQAPHQAYVTQPELVSSRPSSVYSSSPGAGSDQYDEPATYSNESPAVQQSVDDNGFAYNNQQKSSGGRYHVLPHSASSPMLSYDQEGNLIRKARAGMTPKGGDIFPRSNGRNMNVRHSESFSNYRNIDSPPSYDETLARQREIQRQNTQKARQLYEESIRQYETTNDSDEREMRPEQPRRNTAPSKTGGPQNNAQARQSNEVVASHSRQSNEVANSHGRQSHEAAPPHSRHSHEVVRPNTLPIRDTHQTVSSSPSRKHHQPSSEHHRKMSTEQRRLLRAQRLSDTRLDSHRSKHNSQSSLVRSKSDSSEHINKIGKFKELKPLDSNILQRRKRSKSQQPVYESAESESDSDYDQRPSLPVTFHQRRRSSGVQSVKHRDWHKDLAEKYSATALEKIPVPKTNPKYFYVNKNQNPSGKWVPPVHPTKDLVVIQDKSKSSSNSHETKQMSRHQHRHHHHQSSEKENQSKVERHHRASVESWQPVNKPIQGGDSWPPANKPASGPAPGVERWNPRNKQVHGVRMETDQPTSKPAYVPVPKPLMAREAPAQVEIMSSTPDDVFRQDSDHEEHTSVGLSWSVARMRNMYEPTNPRAEGSYV